MIAITAKKLFVSLRCVTTADVHSVSRIPTHTNDHNCYSSGSLPSYYMQWYITLLNTVCGQVCIQIVYNLSCLLSQVQMNDAIYYGPYMYACGMYACDYGMLLWYATMVCRVQCKR